MAIFPNQTTLRQKAENQWRNNDDCRIKSNNRQSNPNAGIHPSHAQRFRIKNLNDAFRIVFIRDLGQDKYR
jgi:hypothetical protein